MWNQQNPPEQQWHANHINGSNMSLNLPPNGYYPQQFEMGMGPPPSGWINGYCAPDGYSYQSSGMIPPMHPNSGKKKRKKRNFFPILI